MSDSVHHDKYQAVVVGTSAGGLEALTTLLGGLPREFSLPVLIVQHQTINTPNDGFLETYFTEHSRLVIKEAVHGMPIVNRQVYLSVPGYHLQVEKDHTISLCASAPVKYAIPSVDVLFETALDVYRSHLIGILLTGANDDGVAGLKKIKNYGGLAMVQDPETAYARTMPEAAMKSVPVDHVLTLEKMAMLLTQLDSINQKNVAN